MCSDERFEEIKENNGKISKQASQEVQDATEEIERETQQEDERVRSALL